MYSTLVERKRRINLQIVILGMASILLLGLDGGKQLNPC